jgi:exosortase
MSKDIALAAAKRYAPYFLPGAALVAAFSPMFAWMYDRFTEPESYYSHGFLIPLIVLFIVYQKWQKLQKLPLSSSLGGLYLLSAGLVLYLAAGVILNIGFIAGTAFILVLIGVILYLFGKTVTAELLAPLSFFFFMVPLPKVLLLGITFKMKMMAAAAAAFVVTHMGLAIQHAGSIFYLPRGVLTVENECSGISSLISLVTLSVVFAYFTEMPFYKKCVMVACALPIAVAANMVRILCLILSGYVYGVDTVKNGVLHYGAGFALWCAALLLFTGCWRVLEWNRAD